MLSRLTVPIWSLVVKFARHIDFVHHVNSGYWDAIIDGVRYKSIEIQSLSDDTLSVIFTDENKECHHIKFSEFTITRT